MRKLIMVIDDDSDIRKVMTELLESEGFDVITAANGKEAWDYLGNPNSALPDLLIIDLLMPVMTGQELLMLLSLDARVGCISRIVVSAAVRDKHSYLNYTPKPLDLNPFLELVYRCVNEKCTGKKVA